MAMTEKAAQFVQGNMERGRPIPGQSLTNDPSQPYNWEKAPEFTNSKEAMLYVFENLTVPETTANILLSLSKGIGVIDIASITLYTGFTEGKWNPDLMMMLMEPLMYLLMALAEKADIQYRIDDEDDEDDEDSILEDRVKNISETLKAKERGKMPEGALPSDIVEKIETLEMPKESLLAKTEEPIIEEEQPQSLLGQGQ